MKYEPVIGLEVHVEPNTKSKMFCSCSADYFGKEPNTHTCPVCLGLPGALPMINTEAINSCIKIGLALNCQVSPKSLFERKNYFYPDLPKGYQISQYRFPLCTNGWLEVLDKEGSKIKIGITRVHQEEDTGKLTHQRDETLIDFNRSGVPLVEIVTKPDFKNVEQVKCFAKALQQIFRDLGVSSADMEKGEMRLEANISLRKVKAAGSQTRSGEAPYRPVQGEANGLPNYRIELKNINSFRFMAQAIEYEIKRQSEVLEKGEELTQQTRGWDENKKQTFPQRDKEEAHDYRYFPDPDLPELGIEESRIKNIELSLPELSQQRQERLEREYNLPSTVAATLMNRGMVKLFEQALKQGKKEGIEAKTIANFLVNTNIESKDLSPDQIIRDLVSKKSTLDDESELGKLIEAVIKENPRAVEDYKNGKTTAIQVLIGAVRRKSDGQANADIVKKLLVKALNN